jgi:hypothetical protein
MSKNKTKPTPGCILPVLVSPEDMKAFRRAAKASEHKKLPAWIRRTLRDAAEKQ